MYSSVIGCVKRSLPACIRHRKVSPLRKQVLKSDQAMPSRRKTGREPSVVRRVSDILNLFSEDRPQIELGDAEAALGLSQATAYRYLREMHEVGLLSRVSGRFMPGPKMIELEFIIARYDPLLVAAREPMKSLSYRTGCDVLLGRLYDIRVVNVASILIAKAKELNFAPGRTVPLFRGSQARVVLAAMDRRARRRVFDAGIDDPDRDRIGKDWTAFNATLQKNKRDRFYISRGELDDGVTGIAAPVFDDTDAVIGSIVIVLRQGSPAALSESELVQAVKDSAERITGMIRSSGE
jgi:DNA-binding IclR family transcriptional regulator